MKDLSVAYAMKKKQQKLAQGGMVKDEEESGYEDMPEVHDAHDEMAMDDEDIIGRVMKAKSYSKGGMIANGGEDKLDDLADGKPNEFDDLALRDDLEFSYTGENSGDELGDAKEDDDRADIISRVMKSRALKDRLPKVR